MGHVCINHGTVVMHKPIVDEREQLMSIKLCVVFQLKKKSGNLEGCFFKSCLVCWGKKEEKKKRISLLHVIHV